MNAVRDKPRQLSNVLCIDDEVDFQSIIRIALERLGGIKAHFCTDPRLGLARAREVRPDLILLDLMMPEMDGWEVYQQLKADEKTRHIPVIVVTAKAQSIDRVLGLHIAKVDDYIAKPFSPQELLNSVEKVLQKQ